MRHSKEIKSMLLEEGTINLIVFFCKETNKTKQNKKQTHKTTRDRADFNRGSRSIHNSVLKTKKCFLFNCRDDCLFCQQSRFAATGWPFPFLRATLKK